MKAELKFDMSNLDDRQEFKKVMKSSEMASVIWEFIHNSRKRIEQEFENEIFNKTDCFDGIERCFEHFHKLLEEESINIDELWS